MKISCASIATIDATDVIEQFQFLVKMYENSQTSFEISRSIKYTRIPQKFKRHKCVIKKKTQKYLKKNNSEFFVFIGHKNKNLNWLIFYEFLRFNKMCYNNLARFASQRWIKIRYDRTVTCIVSQLKLSIKINSQLTRQK